MAACENISPIEFVILFIDWRVGVIVSRLSFTAKTSDNFMFSIIFFRSSFFHEQLTE